ncbi:MAG: twin-arginine translocase TatA/TatE family subunit [Anaerolineales bacterium]|nr:twin-arginine translocase TatA/TatE family subunit [Anaerolineales bacterium]
MEFLGIGPLELLFIVFIALIILGPKDMEKTAKTIGKGLNQLVRSDTWKTVTEASRKLRTLPNELMREANLEELPKAYRQKTTSCAAPTRQELSKTVKEIQKPFEAWTTQPAPITNTPENPPELTHTIAAQEKSDEMTSQ